jgi:hypothetical protein
MLLLSGGGQQCVEELLGCLELDDRVAYAAAFLLQAGNHARARRGKDLPAVVVDAVQQPGDYPGGQSRRQQSADVPHGGDVRFTVLAVSVREALRVEQALVLVIAPRRLTPLRWDRAPIRMYASMAA